MNTSVAFFVSPHGYGHAARASAVMAALANENPNYHFHIFTKVPEWFFRDSISSPYTYHDCLTDIGVIQLSPLNENVEATISQLELFLPFGNIKNGEVINKVKEAGCKYIICDISPLGIYTAGQTGLPSILIENFTWDWIYSAYLSTEPRFSNFIRYLESIFKQANFHIQTEPVCQLDPSADLITPPVARKTIQPAQLIREKLDIAENSTVVLISLGGIQADLTPLFEILLDKKSYIFIVPGGSTDFRMVSNLRLLSHHSDFYHPDLVNACNIIIGKTGYSTIAEAFYSGIPFGYIPRPTFRESTRLAEFIQSELGGFEISESSLFSGEWLDDIPNWINDHPRSRKIKSVNGADKIAKYISSITR